MFKCPGTVLKEEGGEGERERREGRRVTGEERKEMATECTCSGLPYPAI